MSTVNDEPLIGREEGRKLYEESDKLLSLAETLQEKCEQHDRRWWLLTAIHVSIFLPCFAFALYFIFRALPFRLEDLVYNGWMWGALLAFLYLVAGTAYAYYMRERIDRKLARERRALHSIVDLLRDLEKGIAEKNNLSSLERAEFRIRLSRFDIGPGR